ncbi:MAG: methylmalonyl Co-A mutase-associated GTPase MeaB [Caldilineales bacterium]|nr:methylmalonyl Co-A mutase-associated GTPase MeaB [Caldilineales bacterium]MDW8318986.1 methylmalonyl Co-A mutase-associated GTPase MeaB [Anaerolineae bacterium]
MTLVDDLLSGNRRALAKAITLVENDGVEAHQVLAALYPRTGRAHVVGITGSPGTGKSTLVNALAKAYRQLGYTVGVVAVDPTSPFTGGALLGDRVRMRDLSGDPGIFIRSMATRGSLGGLAQATADVILVLDAAGFQRILVETVGVGQAEVDIASTAHTTVVVEAPGLGDEVQAIKAGVLEIADILAVNKADREGADKTVTALQMMLGMGPSYVRHHGQTMQVHGSSPEGDGWLPPIVKTVALRDEGVTTLRDEIERHRAYLQESGELERREQERARTALIHILQAAVLRRLATRVPTEQLQALVMGVANRELDPYSAADQLLPLVLDAD